MFGYTLIELGSAFACESQATGLNNRGWVAGSCLLPDDDEAGDTRAWLWRDGAPEALAAPGEGLAAAQRVNDAGQVLGWVHRREEGAVIGVTCIWQCSECVEVRAPDGCTIGHAINGDGLVAGHRQHLFRTGRWVGFRAFLWDGNALVDLRGLTDSGPSYAAGLNDLGHSSGNAATASGARHAVLWRNGAPTDLGVLPGHRESYAGGVNNHDQVVGHSTLTGTDAWPVLWRDGEIVELPRLGHGPAHARAINDRGQAVGYATAPDGGRRAVLWQDGEVLDLNELLPDGSCWVLESASDINEAGQIVGEAAVPDPSRSLFERRGMVAPPLTIRRAFLLDPA